VNADWLGAPRLRTLRTIGARGIKTWRITSFVYGCNNSRFPYHRIMPLVKLKLNR